MINLLRGAALAALLGTLNLPLAGFAQGSLTPPGAPAPGMKTLTQIEPRTPISSLPYFINIPGSYYLTGSLTGAPSGYGILITSGNVSLDLGGFTLTGGASSGTGITVENNVTNITVRHGSLAGWGNYGVDSYSYAFPRNMLFEDLTISGCGSGGMATEAGSIVRDCFAFGNVADGFYSAGGEMSSCISRNNGGNGFTVNNCTLTQCRAEYNVGNGFALTSSRAVEGDSQNNTGNGFMCLGTGDEIRQCRISASGNMGILIETGCGENVIADCEIGHSGADGLYTIGSGAGASYIARNNFTLNANGAIILNDSNNYLEDNHVVSAGGVTGIEVTSSALTNNVAVRNVVVGGGSAAVNYSGSGNDFGPIGSAATGTSPWANISH